MLTYKLFCFESFIAEYLWLMILICKHYNYSSYCMCIYASGDLNVSDLIGLIVSVFQSYVNKKLAHS